MSSLLSSPTLTKCLVGIEYCAGEFSCYISLNPSNISRRWMLSSLHGGVEGLMNWPTRIAPMNCKHQFACRSI